MSSGDRNGEPFSSPTIGTEWLTTRRLCDCKGSWHRPAYRSEVCELSRLDIYGIIRSHMIRGLRPRRS